METKEKVHVVRQENLHMELERFCSEKQTRPLIMFYDTFVTPQYYPADTLEKVANKVFGFGKKKLIEFDTSAPDVINKQIAFLKELPQRLFVLRSGSRIGGYDSVVLYAEKLMRATGKHVIAMIGDKNRIVDESLGSNKIMYWDKVVETFLTWRDRAQVWVADRSECYAETRQVYLACLKHSVLDLLKEWSEKGMTAEVARALEDHVYLNQQYEQYVGTCPDIPYLLKYADFDERLIKEEMDTEFGKVVSVKAENLEPNGGIELRLVSARWRRITRELRLDVVQS